MHDNVLCHVRNRELWNTDSSVLSRKFIGEIGRENAGPSTPFGAKGAPNSAQDDSFVLARSFDAGPIDRIKDERE